MRVPHSVAPGYGTNRAVPIPWEPLRVPRVPPATGPEASYVHEAISAQGIPPLGPMYRQLRLCSNRGGYEAIPEPPSPLDLREVKAVLEREGIRVVDARVMLIASLDPEVTISRAGRLLFKTRDARVAERAFTRLKTLLGLTDGGGEPATERPGG